jgi:lysophospholipase L1-like esterase
MRVRYVLRGVLRKLLFPRYLVRDLSARLRPEPASRFLQRLECAREPEWTLRGFVELHASPDCFDPTARPHATRIAASANDDRVLALLNSYSRRYRQQRFHARMDRGWSGLRIVSEGDSWFQFPLLVEDMIDHLSPRHAVYSLGQGGDTLEAVLSQRFEELFPALERIRPDCVLISGGGNDMVKDGGLARLVHEYRDGASPTEYPNAEFDDFVADLLRRFRLLFTEIGRQWPGLPIIFHGYDRPIPRDDPWLGRPLAARGIFDAPLQRRVIATIMDRYNETQAELARTLREQHGLAVHHVDCRGAIRDREWYDAMHPDDAGFARAARRLERQIRSVTRARGARG